MNRKIKLGLGILLAGLVGMIFAIQLPLVEASFVANNLLDDSVFDMSGSMSADQIDAWLNNNFPNSCLSTKNGFTTPLPTGYSPSTGYTYGGAVSAGQAIATSAQAYGLNPQVILATLEKESSVVSGNASYRCQYISTAMGYDCPDSGSCPQNPATESGFSKQIIHATWLLKFDEQHSKNNYNWAVVKPGWDNSDDIGNCYSGPMTQGNYQRGSSSSCNQVVSYDGFTTIDGVSVHMDTGATAALYHYTPHFHGNQLFVQYFESWFGGSADEGYVLATSAADNGDTRQWVVYHGVKHLISDTATLKAWGLDKVTLYQWSGTYLGSFPTATDSNGNPLPLSRLMRSTGSQDVYFVDNGNCYRVTSPQMLAAWNFNSNSIIDVSTGLGQVPTNSGNLTYAIKGTSNTTDIFLVDSGVRRRYSNPDIFAAWEGDNATYTTISDAYFNSMSTDSDIISTKVSAGAGQQEYQVVAGQKLLESTNVAQLYPGSAQPNISVATINRLLLGVSASQFIRASNSATIYLVDAAAKHAVGSPDLVRAWGVGSSPLVNIVTQGNLNLLPTSSTAINTFEADVSGQLYLMDGRKITIPANLDSIYRTTGNVYSPSSPLMAILPNGETATDFIKGFQSAPVYLMDSKSIYHISTPADLALWSNGVTITSVSDYVLSQFNNKGFVGPYVSDGTTEYIVESGQKHSVPSSVKSNWQISSPVVLSSTTLGLLPSGTAMTNQIHGSHEYFYISQGQAFLTVDPNISDAWGITSQPLMDTGFVRELVPQVNTMTRFVKSNVAGDMRLFVVDNGVLYYLSSAQQDINLGDTGQIYMAVNPSAITASPSDWSLNPGSGLVVHDASGKQYVIDSGTKRPFPNATVQNYWTNNGSITTQQVTNGFLNLLPNNDYIERAIQGTAAPIYSVEGITKRWIQSPSTAAAYAPVLQVGSPLINLLPNGSNL